MLVSNSSALNILLANNNKLLNDVLKETDNKTLNNLLKQDSASSKVDAGAILKEIFNSIKDGTKTNSSLESMLKNSTILKDLGNVSTNISNLLDSIKDDANLQKFKPLLENFLKNIKELDSNLLKEQFKNSGVFLENKLTQNTNIKLENILNNISNLLKNIDNPQTKNLNEIINNVLKDLSNQNPLSSKELVNTLKSITNSLQSLSNSLNSPLTQNLTNFVNELKNLLNQGSMVESKIENSLTQQTNIDTKSNINNQVKELLLQIKSDILQNQGVLQNKNILPIIENLIKMPDIFTKNESILNNISSNNISTFSNNFATNLNPLLNLLKDSLESLSPQNKEIQNSINNLIKKVENIIQNHTNSSVDNIKSNVKFEEDMKTVLLKMQDDLSSKMDLKSQDTLKTVNNLLTQIDYHQLTSLVSNSNYLYVPFFWEMLEDGAVEIKQKDENKFFCQIKLTLKDFGKVDLMLSLYDDNKLDLTVYAQREHFKTTLRENIQKLKIALNNVDLIPVNIKLLDMKEDEKQEEKPSNIYQNHYNTESIGSRIDIKA